MSAQQEGSFEIRVPDVDGLLEMLFRREEERSASEAETLPRRAVFVTPRVETRSDGTGIPIVSRSVRAAFAYVPDLVLYALDLGRDYEFPSPTDDRERRIARHEEALEETNDEIRAGLEDRGLTVPVLAASLNLPGHDANRGRSGGDKGGRP